MFNIHAKIERLVGQVYTSQLVQEFVASLHEHPEIDHELGAPSSSYYIFNHSGVDFLIDRKTMRISSIFLYGPLPAGLDFSMSRADVLHMRESDVSRHAPVPYDVWEEGDYQLRVAYNVNGAIKMIVLTGG